MELVNRPAKSGILRMRPLGKVSMGTPCEDDIKHRSAGLCMHMAVLFRDTQRSRYTEMHKVAARSALIRLTRVQSICVATSERECARLLNTRFRTQERDLDPNCSEMYRLIHAL